ncbi:MAG: VWA domain-containing protein, partial [Acidobacteria bacterium]|nr:VWA domain-containing protein [Acidobacteriota bacterium]
MRIRAFLLLAGATLVAQEIEEPTLRITVTMVQVDAVVTDKQGKHLTGLKPDDFQVFEDGKQQKISYFSYVPGVSPPPRKLAPASSKKTVTTVVPGGAKATPENTKRTMALVVDDLGLSFTSTHVVKEELRKFVDQQVQPGDLVAILRTGVGIGALQQFTTDKRVLYTAIDRIRWNIRSRTGPFTFTATTPDENRAALQREVDAGKQTSEWTRNAGDELQVL